jgi:hypothetical protein
MSGDITPVSALVDCGEEIKSATVAIVAALDKDGACSAVAVPALICVVSAIIQTSTSSGDREHWAAVISKMLTGMVEAGTRETAH